MDRRGFLKLVGLAPAAAAVAKEVLAQPIPEPALPKCADGDCGVATEHEPHVEPLSARVEPVMSPDGSGRIVEMVEVRAGAFPFTVATSAMLYQHALVVTAGGGMVRLASPDARPIGRIIVAGVDSHVIRIDDAGRQASVARYPNPGATAPAGNSSTTGPS